MKALLFAPMGSLHRRFNGANIDALLSLGYEVHLLGNFNAGEEVSSANKEIVRYFDGMGVKTHSLPFVRASLKKNLRCISEIKHLLKKERFAIVHAHTETGGILLRLARNAKGKSKWFFTPHGMSFYKGSSIISQLIYRPIEKWIASCMDGNIALNKEEYSVLQQWDFKTAYFVHGIGLDTGKVQNFSKSKSEIRSEFKIPENAILLLSVGELNDNKNHQVVLSALGKINNPRVYYLICGVGANKQKLEDLALRCGIADNVILAGFRTDIPDIIHASDIFVFPSFHEGLPVSVMEAMAGGKPVVCSRIRGNVDLIQDGYNGFLFDPCDSSSVEESVNKILLCPDTIKKMGDLNTKIIEDFSYSVVLNELIEVYKAI